MKRTIISLVFVSILSFSGQYLVKGMVGIAISKTQAVEYFNYYKDNAAKQKSAPNSIVIQKSMIPKFSEIFNWYGQVNAMYISNGLQPIEITEGTEVKEYMVIGLIYSNFDILSSFTPSGSDFVLWEAYDTIPAGGVRGIKPPVSSCPPVCD